MKLFQLNQNQNGFTVVELLVSLIVGALLVGSVNNIVTSQVYLSQRGRDLVMANAYAEKKIEELRSIGFLGLADGTTVITGELPTELNAPRTGTLSVSSYSGAIKQVDITISYNEQGATRSHSYRTFVGELGAGQY
jgi:prepilin-type N-terminal cleavage/methylation domain-containing protein